MKKLTWVGIVSVSLWAAAAARGEPVWTAGLDLTLDGETGLSGWPKNGTALHGLGLGAISVASEKENPSWVGYLSVLGIAGEGPTGKFAGDFHSFSNAEAFESLRLYSWWVEGNRGAWSWRAGALLADEEFAGTESGGYLINSGFGWPAFISGNTVNTGPAFFAAALGVRARWQASETLGFQVGIYDGDSFDSPEGDAAVNRQGWHYRLNSDQGAFIISEVTAIVPDTPWTVRTGVWLHTADFSDVLRDGQGGLYPISGYEPHVHSGNYGYYGSLEWTRPIEAERKWTAHLRGGLAPENRNTVHYSVDAGLAWVGPCASRSEDVLALGWLHSRFSGDFARAAELSDPGLSRPDFEQVWELSYTMACGEHWSIQPDVQWIQHLGGSPDGGSATVAMVRVLASF